MIWFQLGKYSTNPINYKIIVHEISLTHNFHRKENISQNQIYIVNVYTVFCIYWINPITVCMYIYVNKVLEKKNRCSL